MEVTNDQRLSYLVGRLEGLAGTVRFQLDEECREELKELSQEFRSLVKSD